MLRTPVRAFRTLMPLVPRRKLGACALTSLIWVAGICGVAHADVYRWVDARGEARYTDRWVPGSELIKSNKPRPFGPDAGPAPAAAKGAPNQGATSKLQQQSAEQAVKQDVAKTKEVQC